MRFCEYRFDSYAFFANTVLNTVGNVWFFANTVDLFWRNQL